MTVRPLMIHSGQVGAITPQRSERGLGPRCRQLNEGQMGSQFGIGGGNGGAGGTRGGGGGERERRCRRQRLHIIRWRWWWWWWRWQRWRNSRRGFDPGASEGRRRWEQSGWQGQWRRRTCRGRRSAEYSGWCRRRRWWVSILMPRMDLGGVAQSGKRGAGASFGGGGGGSGPGGFGGTPGTASAGAPGLIIIRYTP